MLRPLHELTAEVAATMDAQHLALLKKVLPAALRVSCYLVRARPGQVVEWVDAEKIEVEDFFTLLRYCGISTDRYEG